jgi:hypothetical protein
MPTLFTVKATMVIHAAWLLKFVSCIEMSFASGYTFCIAARKAGAFAFASFTYDSGGAFGTMRPHRPTGRGSKLVGCHSHRRPIYQDPNNSMTLAMRVTAQKTVCVAKADRHHFATKVPMAPT